MDRVVWAARAAAPSLVTKNWLQSSCCERSLLGEQQSCNNPKIVAEHATGYGEVAVLKASVAQSPGHSLFEDCNARFGRASATLEPLEALLGKADLEDAWIPRAGCIEHVSLRQLA